MHRYGKHRREIHRVGEPGCARRRDGIERRAVTVSRIEDAQPGLRESRMGLKHFSVAESMTDEEFESLRHGENRFLQYRLFRFRGEPPEWESPLGLDELAVKVADFSNLIFRPREGKPAEVSTIIIGNLMRELAKWLACNAARGDVTAQVTLYTVAETIVDLFTVGARQEWEGFKRYAITKPWIPGMVSRSKSLQEGAMETCVKLRQ